LYFILFIFIASVNADKVDDFNKKTTKELIKEIAETEAKRIQLKAQTNLETSNLQKQTALMARKHKMNMKDIANETKNYVYNHRLRQLARDTKLATIRANDTNIDVIEHNNRLKKYNAEQMARIEYQRRINIRNRIDDERRRTILKNFKRKLNERQKKQEIEYKKNRDKEERRFRVIRENMWRKLDSDKRKRKDAQLKREIEMRKKQALEFQKFREEVEMERKMKTLTLAETQRQLMNMRRAEEIKGQIIREGLKYKKLLEERRMKQAEAKAKMIEDLKDKALDLILERANIMRVRRAEAREMALDILNMKKEINQNAELTKKAIRSRRERRAAIRQAKIIAERNRLRFAKIRALKNILTKKLQAEEIIYRKKYAEAKKIQDLDFKARDLVKRLSYLAKVFDRKSIDILKKIKAQKKAIIIRKLLQEKAEEINAKRVLINNFKLKIHKLEEEELKHNMQYQV